MVNHGTAFYLQPFRPYLRIIDKKKNAKERVIMQRTVNKLSLLFCLMLLLFSAGCGFFGQESEETSETNNFIAETENSITESSATTSKFTESTTSAQTTTVTETTTATQTTAAQTQAVTTSAPKATTVTETSETKPEDMISATYAGLYNAETMKSSYTKAAEARIYPASLTKILTACTALNYVSPDTVFTVGSEQNLVQPGSSLCLIRAGHKISLRGLLTGMLMSSGNDAAYTIAVNVARTVAKNPDMSDTDAVNLFVELMNDYSSGLGMKNSLFVNPDGWDNSGQYSTVHDLAVISAHAMENSEIRDIVSSYTKRVVFASGENITWTNTNALLNPDGKYYLPQAVGLKTGTTEHAGNCLIAALEMNGTRYIAIVSGCADNTQRYESIHAMVSMIK